MDFKLANHYAEQVSQQGSEELRQQLIKMCIPCILKFRKEMGFYSISLKEVRQELAADAVSDAIMDRERRKLPFTICLRNSFRKLCRQRERITREQHLGDIMIKCDILSPPFMIGIGSRPPSAEDQAHKNELLDLAHKAIDNHDRFSKKVIFQKMRGSTYPDMAKIFKKTANECKRVFWHDMNDVRKKIGHNYLN